MKYFLKTLEKVYGRVSYIMLSISLFVVFIFIDYLLLTKTTSWEKFLVDNSKPFIVLSLTLTVVNNVLIAFALTILMYVIEQKKKYAKGTMSNSIAGVVLSLVSVGCAVCAGFLLPLLGIAASLSAFPFQGLEIKTLSIIVLLYVIYMLSHRIRGVFVRSKLPYIVGIAAVVVVYLIPRLPWQVKSFFKSVSLNKQVTIPNKDIRNLFDEINPEKGYEINATYGTLGPDMIKMGVLDLDKFKAVFEKSSAPLTDEQFTILTRGSNKKIKIDRENSYFLLDFFWAVGLANKSKILTDGEMMKYGNGQAGNFASTGGWSLASGDPMNYYAKGNFIPLTAGQEDLVDRVASNIYRPCCNNSTAFPDCNHGMALLGVLELMASNGATENQMYEAAKYFNAYWFPGNYYDIALYFKNKEGKDFRQVPGQVILSKEFSSASGAQSVKKWLIDKGVTEAPPKQGGGCGV
jgi:hypothetical protein